jgi:activator of 2-hydroxyglutaryl-CoA dehydratase
VLEIFILLNELKHNLKFQVDPPFTYSNSVQNIPLEDSEISAGTNVVVTGWGAMSVSQYFKSFIEQQEIFARTSANGPKHIIILPLSKMAHLVPDY